VLREVLQITLLRPGRNLGCAGGRNLALNYLASNTDLSQYVVLDNDTILPEEFFCRLADLDMDPLEVVAPVILSLHDGGVWTGGTLSSDGEPAVRRVVPEPDSDPVAVDWAPGACLVMRTEAWDTVGEFDEWMDFYFEDTDWCVKLGQNGGNVVVRPELRIEHEKHHSLGGKASPERTRFWARNGTVFRAHSVNTGGISTAKWTVVELLRSADDLVTGDVRTARGRVKGLTEGVIETVKRKKAATASR
jgi:GT2 family glycosyltransferase